MKHLMASASALVVVAPFCAVQAQQIYDLGEIVVSATVVPTVEDRIGVSVDVLGPEQLSPALDTTLAGALNKLPGVTASQTGPAGTAGEIRIRGSQERYVSVYVDGIKVNDPSTTSGLFANFGTINTNGLTRVEVLKGSQSALYGASAVAGVINVYTLPLTEVPEGTRQRADVLYGSYNTISAGYGLTNRSGPWTLAFGLAYLQSDGFSAADENNGNTEADGVRETRFSFGAAYDVNDEITIGMNAFVERGTADFDEFGFVPEDGTPDETGTRDSEGVRVFAVIERGIWQHDLSLSYYHIKRTQELPTTSAPFATPFSSRFDGDRTRFAYIGSGQVRETLLLSLGLDVQEDKADYNNLAAGSESVTTWGGFAEGVYSLNDQLDVTGTVRYDDNSSFGGEPTGRLAFAYRPRDGIVLRGNVATGYRPPTIDELYGDYPAFFFTGNPNLQPETSLSYELGVDLELNNTALFSATVFRTDIDNLIATNATFSSLENKPGTSTRQGVEISGAVALSDTVSLTGAYTYIDAQGCIGGAPCTGAAARALCRCDGRYHRPVQRHGVRAICGRPAGRQLSRTGDAGLHPV